LQNAERYAEQQRSLQEFRDSEERFRSIYEGSYDAVMLLDEKGFFDANQRTLELFGYDRLEQFTALTPFDVSPPQQADGQDSQSAAMGKIQQAYQTGEARFDWTHQRSNGQPFPAEVLLSALITVAAGCYRPPCAIPASVPPPARPEQVTDLAKSPR
jgi:PAS domain S-box-containing protein